MKKRKKKKIRAIFILLCLVALAVFGGVKGGEYLAHRLTKPIDDSSALSGSKGEGIIGKQQPIAEDDALNITAAIMEFIEAEHTKKTDKLTNMIAPDYYSTFTKNLKSLSNSVAAVQDMNFKDVSKTKVNAEVTYIKNNKKATETITMELFDSSWKVTDVKR